MPHEPEPWQTNAARPAVVIEKPRGTVSISALGKERFRVEAPGHDSEVEGYDEAQALAHELAAELGVLNDREQRQALRSTQEVLGHRP